MSFYECYRIVLENEGGNVSRTEAERRGDPGGRTSRGITEATLRRLGIPGKPETLSATQVRELYYVHYWVPVSKLEYIAKGAALAAFDFGVQSGPETAIRALQRIVGAVPDGIVGPETCQKLDAYGVVPALLDLSASRRRLLICWVLRRPRRLALLRGVLARVDRVARLAVQWVVDERPTQPADVLWRGYARVPRT